MMDINKFSYYKWKKRQNNPSVRMIQRETNINMIREIHEKHLSHEYRWINSYLRKHFAVVMSNNHLHFCCKYAGIISQANHYKYIKPGKEKNNYPNSVMKN